MVTSAVKGSIPTIGNPLQAGWGAVASAGTHVKNSLPTSVVDPLKAGWGAVASAGTYTKDTVVEGVTDTVATARDLYTIANVFGDKSKLDQGLAVGKLGLRAAKHTYRAYKLQKNIRSAPAAALSGIKKGVSAIY